MTCSSLTAEQVTFTTLPPKVFPLIFQYLPSTDKVTLAISAKILLPYGIQSVNEWERASLQAFLRRVFVCFQPETNPTQREAIRQILKNTEVSYSLNYIKYSKRSSCQKSTNTRSKNERNNNSRNKKRKGTNMDSKNRKISSRRNGCTSNISTSSTYRM
jgi:hypothetical protein